MKPTFDLVSKTIGTSFIKYKGDAVRLSKQTPASVDEVILSLKGHKDLQRKVTTFRDSNGQVIERSFDYFDKPYRNRLYSRTDNVIGQDEFVSSTTTKDYVLDRDAMEYYKGLIQFPNTKRTILWAKARTETNHLSENINTGEKFHSQVRINGTNRKGRCYHTFSEFPHIKNNKVENTPVKFLCFAVRTKDNTLIKNSIKSSGVKVPENDSYLGYRALPIEDAKTPFSERYIKERGLEDMKVTVDENYNPLNEIDTRFKAIFCADDGVIYFNGDYKFKSKTELAKTSAHEVEHCWHYYLQGRLNGGDTPWQKDMAKQFGKITDKELKKEAKEYDIAIKNYVPYWKDRDAYLRNKIEQDANKKGDAVQYDYDTEGLTIRMDFPHIPVAHL